MRNAGKTEIVADKKPSVISADDLYVGYSRELGSVQIILTSWHDCISISSETRQIERCGHLTKRAVIS
jgi:hypothetical protein